MAWSQTVHELETPTGRLIPLAIGSEMYLGANKLCGIKAHSDPKIHHAHLSVELLLKNGTIKLTNWYHQLEYKREAEGETELLGQNQSAILSPGCEFTLQGERRNSYTFHYRTRRLSAKEVGRQRVESASALEAMDRALQAPSPLPAPEPLSSLSGRKRSHSESESETSSDSGSPINEQPEPERKRTRVEEKKEHSMVVLARPAKPDTPLRLVWRTSDESGQLTEEKERRSTDGLQWYTFHGPVDKISSLEIGVMVSGGFQLWRKERLESIPVHSGNNQHFAYYTPVDKRFYAKDCANFFLWIHEQQVPQDVKLELCRVLRRFIKQSDPAKLGTPVLMYVNHLLAICAPGENEALDYPLFLYMLGCVLSAFQQQESIAVTLWETNYIPYLSILAWIGKQQTLGSFPLYLLESSSTYDKSALERILCTLTPVQWKEENVTHDDCADLEALRLILTKFADTPFDQLPVQRRKWLVPMCHPYREMLDAHAVASAPLAKNTKQRVVLQV